MSDAITVKLPLRTYSNLNMREHHMKRARRIKAEREAVHAVLCGKVFPQPPLLITMTRIGPRALDSDNLAGSFKGPRDSVAKRLGIDDGSQLLEWRYAQRKGAYAIEIRIEGRP